MRLSKHGRLGGRVNRVVVLMFLVIACLLLRQFLAFLIRTSRTSRYLREISSSPNPHFGGTISIPTRVLCLSIQDKFLAAYLSCSPSVHFVRTVCASDGDLSVPYRPRPGRTVCWLRCTKLTPMSKYNCALSQGRCAQWVSRLNSCATSF